MSLITAGRRLIERRVPHVLAIYLGVSWGVVQFVNFLEGRYDLSPHWTDISLVAFALMIPSVLLFTYNHGKPGRDDWTRAEKLGIPLNVMIAAAALFAVFGNKELGAVTTSVTTTDETGKSVERVIANASFRRRLALFNFDAEAEDTAVAWLRYGLPLALSVDLTQDIFVDVRHNALFREKLRQAGHEEEVNLPTALKRTIAEEHHIPYFTEARVSREGAEFVVDMALYETDRGAPVQRRTYRSADLFTLVDELGAGLRRDLGVPEAVAARDLPVSEVMTSSLPAFRRWADGLVSIQIRDQWQVAIADLEKAVESDPTFAHGWIALHNVYLLGNQAQKAMPALQKAMDNLYRLPERTRFDVKVEYYFLKQDQEKAFAVAKMKVDLFPDDIAAYQLLSQLQNARDDKDGMIASFQKILELDPEQQEQLRAIGALYEGQGDFENALRYYQQYADRFPRQPVALRSLAQLHHLRGEHAESRTLYEKALILAPTDVASMVGLGIVERDLGEFETARKQLSDALAAAGTAEERHRAFAALANYSVFRGRLSEALESRDRMYAEGSKFQAPLQHAVQRLTGLGTYVRAGRAAEARTVFQRVSAELHPPFDVFAALGEMELYVALEQPDEAERALNALEQAIRATGYKFLRPYVTFARGRIAEARGQWTAAITAYQETLKLSPSDLSTHSDMARCYRKLGQTDQAVEHGQRPLVAVPFDPRGNYELGLAYLDAGNREKALEHLRRAVQVWSEADPAYKLPAEAKAKLKDVEAK